MWNTPAREATHGVQGSCLPRADLRPPRSGVLTPPEVLLTGSGSEVTHGHFGCVSRTEAATSPLARLRPSPSSHHRTTTNRLLPPQSRPLPTLVTTPSSPLPSPRLARPSSSTSTRTKPSAPARPPSSPPSPSLPPPPPPPSSPSPTPKSPQPSPLSAARPRAATRWSGTR